MDWKTFWNEFARHKDPHIQVARSSKRLVDEDELNRIADHISRRINLHPTDRLLDVCYGNGLITDRLAERCKEVIGIDFSSDQIQNAQGRDHLARYIHWDALQAFQFAEKPFDKIVCYFSFQYFDTVGKGFLVLQHMTEVLGDDGIIFLGDIPDYKRKHIYFPNLLGRLRHAFRRMTGREPMGKFWRKSTLDRFALKLGLKGKALDQPEQMLYSHYRFDYILKKDSES